MTEPNPIRHQPMRLRAKLPWYFAVPIGLVFVSLVMAGWFWLTSGARPEDRLISILIMPNPVDMVRAVPDIWFDYALMRNIIYTVGRVAAGFLLGSIISIPLGILMGSYGPIRHFFSPLSITAKYLPLAAVVPLAVSLMGSTDTDMKIGFVAMATVFGLLPAVITAIDEVEEIYLKTAYTLGSGQLNTIVRVLMPIAFVRIFEGLRIALAVGWSYIILVEMLYINNQGLGAMIQLAQRRAKPEITYVVIIVIALIGFGLDLLMNAAGYLLFPYRRKNR